MDTVTVLEQLDNTLLPSNTDEAVDFLAQWYGADTRTIITIHPRTGETIRRDFEAQDEAAMRACIEAAQGRLNIYFVANACGPGRSTPHKEEMTGGRCLHLDADLKDFDCGAEELLARIRPFVPPPSVIVLTGGGYQAVWLYDGTFAEGDWARRIEATNGAIAKAIGAAPGCHNINRLLRLPGTINVLNEKKRAAGRMPALAYVVDADWSRRWSYARDPVPRLPNGFVNHTHLSNGMAAIGRLPERWREIIRSGNASDYGDDRSAATAAVVKYLVTSGWDDDAIRAVILNRDHGISAHNYGQPDPDRAARRVIEFARRAPPEIAELNEKHALILIGDKVAVLRETISTDGRPEARLLTTGAFKQWFAPRRVAVNEKTISLADHWLRHPQRRQYEGLVFEPGREVRGYYNLWRGFAVEPRPGDCSRFLAHLQDNVCRGDEARWRWVVGWFAAIFQRPTEKVGTSLVFRGKQGTGKTKIGEVIGSLLGDHYVLVADPRYITGRFNSHLVSCLLLHADEGFWAGDRAAEGTLKDLITGNTHLIEFKGKEPVRVRNHVRLLVTGNPDWLVPAGMEERRFAVLETGEERMRDFAYFAAIDDEMNKGGREALLHHLLSFDLSSVNLREIPLTETLLEQKIASLTAEQGWWLDLLHSGKLPGDGEGRGRCPAEHLTNGYLTHAQKQGVRRRAIETQLGFFLDKVTARQKRRIPMQAFEIFDPTTSGRKTKRGTVYQFPSLSECRRTFEAMIQNSINWEEDPVDWVADSDEVQSFGF
jgi:hypothetical protein